MNSEINLTGLDTKSQQLVQETYRMIQDIHKALFAINKPNNETSREQMIANKRAKLMIKAISRK